VYSARGYPKISHRFSANLTGGPGYKLEGLLRVAGSGNVI